MVDQVTAIVGGTATPLVRNGDEFARISTNVMREGKRAGGGGGVSQWRADGLSGRAPVIRALELQHSGGLPRGRNPDCHPPRTEDV